MDQFSSFVDRNSPPPASTPRLLRSSPSAQVPLLVPTMFIRHLAKFAVSIAIADTLIVLGLLYLTFRSGEAMVQQGGLGPGIVQFDVGGYPEFLGTALYALEGTAFVLPIQHAMKNKHHFPRVTAISGLGIGFMYMAFGLIGYMAFGAVRLAPEDWEC